MRAPYIFLSDDKVKAQWQQASDQIAWIEFGSSDQVRLLVFSPDAKAHGGVKRFIGISTVQAAYSDLQGLGAEWVVQ